MKAGFLESLFNVINSKKTDKNSFYCKFALSSLYFSQDAKVRACCRDDSSTFIDFIYDDNFNGLYLDVSKIKLMSQKIIELFSNSNIPDICKDCCYLENNNISLSFPLKYLYLNHWKSCFLNCSYCKYDKYEDISSVEHFDIMPIIVQLLDSGIIDKKTKIIFECGDAILHPEFDKLMYFFINYEMKDIEIHTSALRYSHSVAEAIGKNIANVFISIDAGCPYIYEKIKGFNKFDLMLSSLKRYQEFEDKNQKRIAFKYMIVNGINDNKKEILDWFMLSRNLGVKKLYLDVDDCFYDEIKYNIPRHIQELLLFASDMSDFNDLKIDFSSKVYSLLKRIKNDKISID